jgi:hypothetical protein
VLLLSDSETESESSSMRVACKWETWPASADENEGAPEESTGIGRTADPAAEREDGLGEEAAEVVVE